MKTHHKAKPGLLVIGPKPPPYHGVSVATEKLLGDEVRTLFDVYHVDLADRRGIQFVDKPDLHDVLLFLQQVYKVLGVLLRRRPSMVYLPISQKKVGFIRDSIFVFICHLRGCKVILHLHGGNFRRWYEQVPAIFRRFIRIVLKRATAMIVLSQLFKTIFEGLLPMDRVFVVSNGVEYTPQRDNKKSVLEPTRKGRTTILYLGTLNRYKGVLALIKCIPLVIKERPEIRFVIAGAWSDEKDKEKAETFISSYRLWQFIDFVGVVSGTTKWRVLEESEIFVFPGIQQEGQPLVVLEAMAAGLPIIYTNRGCLSEVVSDGYNGFEVRKNDPADIAHKILLLAGNTLMMRKMGQRSRVRFENTYTDKHYIGNMLKVFAHVSNNCDI